MSTALRGLRGCVSGKYRDQHLDEETAPAHLPNSNGSWERAQARTHPTQASVQEGTGRDPQAQAPDAVTSKARLAAGNAPWRRHGLRPGSQ